ncbi:hypothetical protein [Ruminococcus sp. 5_1_39BFAA]|uniref:hypothetical protein n=1 Tax=Ruminococcus sp. 5_1_39BFAA TaxID=457412 RepID=UPI00356411A6
MTMAFETAVWYHIGTGSLSAWKKVKEVKRMTDREILELVLEKVSSLENRMASMEANQEKMQESIGMLDIRVGLVQKRIENLELDVKVAERDIRRDIKLLQDGQETLIEVLEQKGILPDTKDFDYI